MSEPLMETDGSTYIIYRGVKAHCHEGTYRVYNCIDKNFKQITHTDSLKIILTFLPDDTFNITPHIKEYHEYLNRRIHNLLKTPLSLRK